MRVTARYIIGVQHRRLQNQNRVYILVDSSYGAFGTNMENSSGSFPSLWRLGGSWSCFRRALGSKVQGCFWGSSGMPGEGGTFGVYRLLCLGDCLEVRIHHSFFALCFQTGTVPSQPPGASVGAQVLRRDDG